MQTSLLQRRQRNGLSISRETTHPHGYLGHATGPLRIMTLLSFGYAQFMHIAVRLKSEGQPTS